MSIAKKIGVVGGGAWGTALGVAALNAGAEATLWARDADLVDSINTDHENPIYLPNVKLPEALRASTTLEDLADCDALLMVIPTQQMRLVFTTLMKYWPAERPLILCAKGIEQASGLLPAGIIRDLRVDQTLAVLSGPSFAVDVVAGKPTAVTLAADQIERSEALCRMLASPLFRPYAADDLTGVEIGGALKNVTAVCCGIAAGCQLGASAGAALMARGFSEMVRYGVAHGAQAQTFMGLSGFGDLVLTCSSTQSRNFSFGFGLGAGTVDISDALEGRVPLAEGAFTAGVAAHTARTKNLDLPILQTVSEILDGTISVDAAIHRLLDRPLKAEKL
ncbi:NAD(P)H-dependent glycerol-3-phosphate dehydrogenase [Pararhizobium sp. IMCC21322]|uniref:NAD(P)H-dependent glycerol-3-phosphate dehydrogenase n=1 Tax=Pararhizobium sp. IMCC21322 TaxID=3067903 RepID=UPI002741F252|nr:NAD(P)H-dependent glycerol-3-phosphate dehydrogenase [Pararhizobium sp. IMCC21322]